MKIDKPWLISILPKGARLEFSETLASFCVGHWRENGIDIQTDGPRLLMTIDHAQTSRAALLVALSALDIPIREIP